MKKLLTKTQGDIFYFQNGVRIEGVPPCIRGNLTNISGDLTGIFGNLMGIRGNLTGISGDLTNVSGNLTCVYGDLSDISGDLDACEITEEDRERGIKIDELVK